MNENNKWMNEWMNECMNEVNERMNEMNEWTDVQVQRQLVEKQPQRDTLPPCRRMRDESTIFRLGPPAEQIFKQMVLALEFGR